jgi:type II secretory pathway predicted ATPase ExeA
MAKVFISHASADGDAAQLVHEWLVADGHQVFLDHDLLDGIELGEEWEQRLHERLRWAEAVVCLVTSAYIDSAWCTAELGVARSRGSRLLPISVEPALTHPLLPSLQYADLSDPTATRTLLAKALLGVGGAWPWPDARPPFPGLDPFDVDLHQVFFGRQPEVEELVELLRSPAERARGAALFLVGPSGCGKSSLVRAGLLPVMADEPGWWCLPPIVPGRQPVQTLLREIAGAARDVGLSWTASDVRRRVEDGGLAETVDDLLLQAGGGRRRLLVVVDQFEELLTRGNQAERGRFAELLEPALGRSVHLVVTLRPEFLEPLLAAPELSALSKRVHPIQPLRLEALRAVVVEPTRSAGLHIDDDLVDRLVADTEDGKALPLLAYTLARLAAGLRRGGRLLESRYDELGGVQGTLVGQANTALAEAVAAGGRTQDHVVRELLRLVTVDQQDRPARWRVPRDELSESAATELEPFVERRLLTTDSENDRP